MSHGLFSPDRVPPLVMSPLQSPGNAWETGAAWPPGLLADLRRVLEAAGAPVLLAGTADELDAEWPRVCAAAPQGRWGAWVGKLKAEQAAGRLAAGLLLLRASTDAEWFGRLADLPRCYLRGRLRFPGYRGEAPAASLLVLAGSSTAARAAFARVFGPQGVLEGLPAAADGGSCAGCGQPLQVCQTQKNPEEFSPRAPSRAGRAAISTYGRRILAWLTGR